MKEPLEILKSAAETFQQRNAVYKDSWKDHGELMQALFPNGVILTTPEEFNRYAKIDNIAMKLCRYCQAWKQGGHEDSAHDIIVYAAFLEALT